MRKLKLDLDRLRVQSFDTGGMAVADVREDNRSDMVGGCSGQGCATDGTVHAHATAAETRCLQTCSDVPAFDASKNPDYCALQPSRNWSECCSGRRC